MTPEAIATAAEELIAGLNAIPVSELVACARENLKATYPVRVSKDESREAPDYTVRQKALEWISAQRAGAPAQRKPIEHKPASDQGKPSPGMLRKGKGSTSGSVGGETPTTKGGA
jgi:hypothetical protein